VVIPSRVGAGSQQYGVNQTGGIQPRNKFVRSDVLTAVMTRKNEKK
jgi:hypothetical protein